MEVSQKRKLTMAAVIVMSSIIISRITGFVRELLIPNMLVKQEYTDAFYMAFRITDLMYNMLVGGAIAAALIPVLASYIAKDKEKDGWEAVGSFINIVFLSMAFICLLGIIFAPGIVPVVAWGFKGTATELTIKLTRILFPSVSFLMLAGLANGVLNSYKRFAAAAYGPTLYNIGGIISIVFLSKYGVEAVTYGVMCSSLLYFLFQLTFAFKNLKYYNFKINFKNSGFVRLFKLAVPSLISSSIVQFNVIITSTYSTLFGMGSVTALNMADRTWQLPYGIFAQGIGIAMLPTLSDRIAVGEVNNFKNILSKGLKTVLLLSFPSAVGFIVLREEIIKSIFQWSKRFNPVYVPTAGAILMFFSIALLAQSIVAILNRAFYANNDTKTPLYIGASSIVINIALSSIFIRVFPSLGVGGMALAYSLASFLNAVLLLIVLNKKMKDIYIKELMVFMGKVLPAAIVMGIVLFVVNKIFPVNEIIGDNFLTKISQLLLLSGEIIMGVIIYFTLVLIMKIEEAQYLLDIIMIKIKSIKKNINFRFNKQKNKCKNLLK